MSPQPRLDLFEADADDHPAREREDQPCASVHSLAAHSVAYSPGLDTALCVDGVLSRCSCTKGAESSPSDNPPNVDGSAATAECAAQGAFHLVRRKWRRMRSSGALLKRRKAPSQVSFIRVPSFTVTGTLLRPDELHNQRNQNSLEACLGDHGARLIGSLSATAIESTRECPRDRAWRAR